MIFWWLNKEITSKFSYTKIVITQITLELVIHQQWNCQASKWLPELSSGLRASDFLKVKPMKLVSFDANICIMEQTKYTGKIRLMSYKTIGQKLNINISNSIRKKRMRLCSRTWNYMARSLNTFTSPHKLKDIMKHILVQFQW